MAQKLHEAPLTDVTIKDEFWTAKIETNRTVTIPHCFKECEQTGRIANFDRAAKGERGDVKGFVFNDSDTYKTIEAAAYSLATHPDPELAKYLDDLIAKIAAAQRPDGYLDTYYQIKFPEKRFTNLKDHHELYCAGHLIEAAVAHYRATKKSNFLDVATKLADLLCNTFGPDKRHDVDGHEEIELALFKLADATGEMKYQQLGEFFIHQRGNAQQRPKLYGAYYQDTEPVELLHGVVGHAVRQMYLACAMTDLAERGEQSMSPALDRMWSDLVERKMYVTGGVGAKHKGEAFGEPYELPNETAYAETCAAIGNALWNQRMNLLTGDAKFADVVELVTYNGMLSGVSLSGDKFFYVNPLASKGDHHRQSWYDCACCPPNVARFIASLPGRAYAIGVDRATRMPSLYVNLYAAGEAKLVLPEGVGPVTVKQDTQYPWAGNVRLALAPEASGAFNVKLRVPGWCERPAVTFSVDDKPLENVKIEKGYATIPGPIHPDERLDLTLPMPVRRIHADPRVKDDVGKVAIARGPIIYCAEAVDNPDTPVGQIKCAPDGEFKVNYMPDLLGGVMLVRGEGFRAVPYYAWDNRTAGEMAVWIEEK